MSQQIRRSLRIARGPRFQDTYPRTEVEHTGTRFFQTLHTIDWRRVRRRGASKSGTAYDNTLAQAIREFRRGFAKRWRPSRQQKGTFRPGKLGDRGAMIISGAQISLGGVEQMTEPSKEELMARIAELESQVGGRKRGTVEFRVGEKGGVSVYGLGRFPVTLYYEQWIRLLDAADSLRAFLEENKSKLKLKPKE